METWSTHQLYQKAIDSLGPKSATNLRGYAQQLISRGVAVVFTLGHLSRITGVDYEVLRNSVSRKRESSNYRMYAINKRSGGRRFIHAVSTDLLRVQQFINREILQKCVPHHSSFAFHRSGGIKECATMHCGASWLFQFDLADFFYDITEIDVYKVFQELGYRNLMSFELARLCTTTRLPQRYNALLFRDVPKHNYRSACFRTRADPEQTTQPYPGQSGAVGVLPQGAPTSPMLANLVAKKLDDLLYSFAQKSGFVYTRYADDITLSASYLSKRQTIRKIYRKVIHLIRQAGFKENENKIRIAGPGSKKLVLGLLVDGAEPRISKETYHRVDRHLYACTKYGLSSVASHEGFDSAYGFYNHLAGLIAFIKNVDKKRWGVFSPRFEQIPTPWSGDK